MNQTLKKLQEKVNFYEYILDNVNAGIYVNRTEGRAVWRNKKIDDMIEHSLDEINEMGVEAYSKDYFHPDDEPIFNESIKHLYDKNIGHCTSIYRQKDKNGDWQKILSTVKVSKWYPNGFPEEAVMCGIVLSDELSGFTKIESLLKENIRLKNRIKLNTLTKREEEILKCIAQGKSTKIIADIKNISFHTVESHRKNIMKKLGINNMGDLVRFATECGVY